jgi:hypothetical protein
VSVCWAKVLVGIPQSLAATWAISEGNPTCIISNLRDFQKLVSSSARPDMVQEDHDDPKIRMTSMSVKRCVICVDLKQNQRIYALLYARKKIHH